MSKLRIYEYAKQQNKKSKEIMEILREQGLDVSSHMQTLEDEYITILNEQLGLTNAESSNTNQQKSSTESVVTSTEDVVVKTDDTTDDEEIQKALQEAEQEVNKDDEYLQELDDYDQSTERITKAPKEAKDSKRKKKSNKNKEKKNKKQAKSREQVTPDNIQQERKEDSPNKIYYQEGITVGELAEKLNKDASEIVKNLFMVGIVTNINQSLDQDSIELICSEYGVEAEEEVIVDSKDLDAYFQVETNEDQAVERPAVVTIMGHVDHGKTTLLDSIRNTRVTDGEAGGITQHIGAYQIEANDKKITFLDTPGHAAFTTMRARGAQVTDITILVVAADDGVMPQTAEAIDHARAAGTPIIVAINKMDKESADPDRVLNELTVKEIVPEQWGGDVPVAMVSAHTGQGIDELLDIISIQAELLELKASEEGAAQGVVIEARVDNSRGAVTSILVQNGTLKVGDLVLAGASYGRVRAMTDENGKRIQSAGPSIPVEILGLPEAPMAGDEVLVVNDEKKAREVADARMDRERQKRLERQSAMRLENIMASMGKKDVPIVNVVLKTDVRGTLEALHVALADLATDEVKVRVIGSGVGAITESDVTLAESSEAVLLGFNVRADNAARQKADADGIDIRYYSIIYQLIDDVKAAMSGKLAPEHRETILGVAEVREVFHSSKFGAAAGCMVLEGMLHRNKPIRVLRDDVVVFQGELESLRRYKEVVEEVRAGMECGLAVKGYKDIKEKDKIEVYDVQLIKRSL